MTYPKLIWVYDEKSVNGRKGGGLGILLLQLSKDASTTKKGSLHEEELREGEV